jgi:MotA/TolQ/ExbB proton channel family
MCNRALRTLQIVGKDAGKLVQSSAFFAFNALKVRVGAIMSQLPEGEHTLANYGLATPEESEAGKDLESLAASRSIADLQSTTKVALASAPETAPADMTDRANLTRDHHVDFRRQELDAEFARRKPLRDWLLMSALCLTLACIVSGRRMIEAVWKDHTGVAPCIAAIFLITFIKSLIDVSYIDLEFKKTDEQIRLLWSTNNIKRFLDRASPSLFRHHVGNLVAIFKRDDQINQDNLIELIHARLKSRVRPLDIAANIMVSLGLVGTIVGLITSVGGLGTAMTHAGADQEGLLAGMNETLGGMGTAFAATLLGAIFGGVILRVIYTSVNSQAEHLVAHIAEITEVYLLPVLRDAARERRQMAVPTADAKSTSNAPARSRPAVSSNNREPIQP